MGWLSQRIEVVRKVLDRRWVKIALGLWPFLASYDLFVSQLLPEPWADRAPKMRDIIAETSGWLPWWGWILILMGILIVALFEYAVWRSHPNKSGLQSELKADTAHTQAAIIPTFDPSWTNDVPLLDAIWRVTLGKWDARVKYPENDYEALKPFWDALIGIRQKAFEGKLPIWARRIMRPPSTLLEVVPPQFWINHDFSPSFCRPSDHEAWVFVTHELLVGETRGARTNVWEGFMTSRAAIEKLWPAKS